MEDVEVGWIVFIIFLIIISSVSGGDSNGNTSDSSDDWLNRYNEDRRRREEEEEQRRRWMEEEEERRCRREEEEGEIRQACLAYLRGMHSPTPIYFVPRHLNTSPEKEDVLLRKQYELFLFRVYFMSR